MRFVLALTLLLAAAPAFSQSAPPLIDAPPSPPAAVSEPSPSVTDQPSATDHLRTDTQPRNQLGFRSARLVGEMFGAGLAGGTLAIAGAVVGCGLDHSGGMFGCLEGLVIGAGVGDLVGILAGTVLTGYLLDGNGSVTVTALGEVLGLVVGAGIAVALSSGSSSNPAASSAFASIGGLALLGMPLLGAAIGFEATSDFRRSLSTGHASVMPLLAPTARGNGALVGLSGSF